MEAVAWHWLDDRTLMVLGDDMQWYKLDGLYLAGVTFEGLDMDASEECEIMLTQRYSPEKYHRLLDEFQFDRQEPSPEVSRSSSDPQEPPCP